MKLLKLFSSITIYLIFSQSCDDKPTITVKYDSHQDRHNWWHCPDNMDFPPLSIKYWDKAPALNRRLPEFEETQDGTSLIYYDPGIYPDAKSYNMTLPKLASFFNPYTEKLDTVIVIQIVQTDLDTVVGYRYLTGGNGTYNFRDFHFLTDAEVKEAVGK
jgi:hypothetical protein